MAILQDLIVSVRNIRAELKVEQKAKLPIEVFAEPAVRSLIERNQGALERLANVEEHNASSSSRWPRRPARAARRASMCA